MKNTKLKLPTGRLSLSPATLSAILPGVKKICSHLSGRKLESNLNPNLNDPILIRLDDRYANRRFDRPLARSFCDLKDRLLAVNRKGGGDLQLSLTDLTMIAFAIRHGRSLRESRNSWNKRFEKRIENQRKRLYRATVSEVGPRFYKKFREHWSAFMEWIRHKLQYDKLSKRPRRRSSVVKRSPAIKSPRRRFTAKPSAPADQVETETAAWIKELTDKSNVILSEMEIKRGVRLAKEQGRRGRFDGYTLVDILTDKKRFEPMFTKFLIRNKVLIDISVAQSRRAAKIRKAMLNEDEVRNTAEEVGTRNAYPDRRTEEVLREHEINIRASETARTDTTIQDVDPQPSHSAFSQQDITEPLAALKPVKPTREELIQSVAEHMSHMGENFRAALYVELDNMAPRFVANPVRGDLREPSEYFDDLPGSNRGPYCEARDILTILSRYVSVPDSVEIVKDAWSRLC